MRVPAGGRLLSGADVRMMIQLLPLFAGNVNDPVNVAPACRRSVSPGRALLRAACKSPPALTVVVMPVTTGYDVSTDDWGKAGSVCARPCEMQQMTTIRTTPAASNLRVAHI